MSALVDTSILIDALRGRAHAVELLDETRRRGRLHASEMTRIEVLAGLRSGEAAATRRLLAGLDWHPVDEPVTSLAGELGRAWRRSHRGIDVADLAIGATALLLNVRLLTRNVKHFPMFPGLAAPY